jgi:hypothetical protein
MGRVGRTAGPYEKGHTIRLWGKYYVGTTLTNPSGPTVAIGDSAATAPTISYAGAYYSDWTIPDDGSKRTDYVVEWWGALSGTTGPKKGRLARTIYVTVHTEP